MRTLSLTPFVIFFLMLAGCGSQETPATVSDAPPPKMENTNSAAHMSPEALAAKNAAGGR